MKKVKYLSIFLITLMICSCETWDYYSLDEFNLDGEKHSVEVFVVGGITTQKTYHRIFLYKPSDYFSGSQTENITSAVVYVTHNNDTFLFESVTKAWDNYLEDTIKLENPFYQAKEKFNAIVGDVYTLNIEYKGEHFYGSDSIVEAGNFNFDEIPLPIVNYETGEISNGQTADYNLEFQKHHFGYPLSNMWIWCTKESYADTADALNNTSYGATMYSHQFADAQGLFSNIEYRTALSYEHTKSEDTLIVQRVSISDGYYKYLNQKFMETDWKEGVFATQSGNLSTNMSKGAAGYFFTSDIHKREIIVQEILDLASKI